MTDIYETIFQKHLQHLQHPHAQFRVAAINALGEILDRRAFNPLLAIVQDRAEELFVREHAARTIGKFRDIRAVPILLDLFRTPLSFDETMTIRLEGSQVNDILAYIETFLDPILAEHLHLQTPAQREDFTNHMNDGLFYAVRQGLLAIGTPALPMLFEALHDDDPTVRAQVAQTLCYVRDADVVSHLLPRFADPDPHVRTAIVTHSEQLCNPRTIDALLVTATDSVPIVRERTAYTLGYIGRHFERDRMLSTLAQMQDDPDPQVQQRACMAYTLLQEWQPLR